MIVSTAHRADLDELVALEGVGFERGERWSANSWATELGAPGRLVLVGRVAGEVVGVGCFSLLDETAELLRVIVHPDQANHGFARRLITLGKQWAEGSGAARMMLEVRSDNQPALRLYRGVGFVPIARRADYYGSGGDAVVMECSLGAPEVGCALSAPEAGRKG